MIGKSKSKSKLETKSAPLNMPLIIGGAIVGVVGVGALIVGICGFCGAFSSNKTPDKPKVENPKKTDIKLPEVKPDTNVRLHCQIFPRVEGFFEW